ncbi:DUF945 family protein [Billgrantia saliphila]|uniref:DUF945 family protein n=1 Tax=Billgrantia saliphila TaxID=1848458 RepID=UPI0018CC363B|nr:DUF945 family protein [Halomonas saliphila]
MIPVLVALVVAIALGTPYWVGQQVEKRYADYLRQLEAFGYLRVENVAYERGWLSARASYELVMDQELERAYAQMLGSLMTQEIAGEPLRIGVTDRISHGPFTGSLANVEGRLETSGWTFEQLMILEEERPSSHYDASIGFDRVIRGEWRPFEMTLSAGPMLSDAGIDLRYVADYRGGDFRYDPGTGEYRSSTRMGPSRLVEPTAVHTFTGSTGNFTARFPDGVLRELKFHSQESAMVSESREPEPTGESRVEGQTVDIALHFDPEGRFERLASHVGMEGFEATEPDFHMTTDAMGFDLAATRQHGNTWYGELGFDIDGLAMRQGRGPRISAQTMHFQVGVQPESEETFKMVTLTASNDLLVHGMEEGLSFHVETSYGQLRRAGYDTLWDLVYEAIENAGVDDPEALLAIFGRMEQTGGMLMGDRSALSLRPVSFSMGEAGADLELDAELAPHAFAELGKRALLLPENRLELSANVSASLLHKVARESIRQQYSGQVTGSELDTLAKEMVTGQLQEMLEHGIVRREGDDHYSMHAKWQSGALLLNGEPADWLLSLF